MHVITIHDPNRAIRASAWCNENLKAEEWDLYGHNLFTKKPAYDFKFQDAKKATMFALRFV